MELIGKPTINPLLFTTGKIAGYITWSVMIIFMSGYRFYARINFPWNEYIFYSLLFAGTIFLVLSLINLGRSTRLGLPSADTVLKTRGIYRISRNPMYVGFNIVTIASMIYTLGITTLATGIYSILIYHFIILGEEKFLLERFGSPYREYLRRTRRYL